MRVVDSRVTVACAGSGKTYQLVERLTALLKHGARPGEILVITFTNKAAAEVRERLLQKLLEDSKTDPALAAVRRRMLLAAAPEDMLTAHTFHSWFLSLLRNRPWSKNAVGGAPETLADEDILFEESWRRWRRRAEKNPPKFLRKTLAELSPSSLRDLLRAFKNHRNFWLLRPADKSSDDIIAEKESQLQQAEESLQKAAAVFCANAVGDGKDFDIARKAAARLAKGESKAADECLAFLTKTGTLRVALKKHTDDSSGVLSELHSCLQNALTAEEERAAAEFHQAAAAVCEDFDRCWQEVKAENNAMVFDDMELATWGEIKDGAGPLSERLHMRYRHVLIDEFQDTSPLQWQIMRQWLLDGHGDSQSSVFIVGDPKQAIYGFRRGDWRLLQCAEKFLQDYYGAKKQTPENVCRRCGDNILTAVNLAFFGEERMPDFVRHKTGEQNGALPSRVEWHPYSSSETAAKKNRRMRNPLLRPRRPSADAQQQRARLVAAKTREMLDGWRLRDGDGWRPVAASDILILLPRLTHAPAQIDALSAEGIDCAVSGGRGAKFLESFECADILDLLAVLLSPGRDLPLARVLKSPVFSMSDDTLADIVFSESDSDSKTDSEFNFAENSLWEKLQRHSKKESRRARVLLKRWRRRAQTTLLPAHDFLSALFSQGDIVARYRASAPAELRPRVGENLARLLDLSLLIEGGTRPLLAQFLEDARRARGETEAAPSAVGGVRLMTIHAAKGLQSPIVILADADFSKRVHGGADILVDWPPKEKPVANGPSDVVIALRRHRRAHAALREEAKQLEEREQANSLYVAMTRAEQALIIFSPAKPSGVAEWPMTAMQQLAARNDSDSESKTESESKTKNGALFFGDDLRGAADCKSSPPPPSKHLPRPPLGKSRPRTAAMMRGDMRHQILAMRLSGVAPALAKKLIAAEPSIWRQAETMLRSPPLKKLIAAAREILIERDFADGGKVIRPDLVLVGDNEVWIVDYKTGAAAPASHLPQLQSYRRAVSAVHPAKPVRTAILDIRGELHVLEGGDFPAESEDER